ncbi:hypothetical protein DFH09DRAFT_1357814 [Mycena vulgaris]|nr:hypothetical protein DFH09DRAFT_1357814 [Mycena vulgaris]
MKVARQIQIGDITGGLGGTGGSARIGGEGGDGEGPKLEMGSDERLKTGNISGGTGGAGGVGVEAGGQGGMGGAPVIALSHGNPAFTNFSAVNFAGASGGAGGNGGVYGGQGGNGEGTQIQNVTIQTAYFGNFSGCPTHGHIDLARGDYGGNIPSRSAFWRTLHLSDGSFSPSIGADESSNANSANDHKTTGSLASSSTKGFKESAQINGGADLPLDRSMKRKAAAQLEPKTEDNGDPKPRKSRRLCTRGEAGSRSERAKMKPKRR